MESLPGNIDSLKQAESVMNISENGDNNVAQELHSDEYDFNKDNSIQCDIEPDKPTSIQKTLDIGNNKSVIYIDKKRICLSFYVIVFFYLYKRYIKYKEL